MSVRAWKQKAVSASSILWSSGRVVCADRKLTLCTQDVQTENIQSSAINGRAFYLGDGFFGQITEKGDSF